MMLGEIILFIARKKSILLFLSLSFLLTFTGCSKANDQVFTFPMDKVQSVSVYTYDTEENSTTSNWVYSEKDRKPLLNYLKNLSGTRVDKLDTSALGSHFYGVEMIDGDPYTLLFLGDYAINYKGEYYKIDGKKAERMCQSIVNETQVWEGVSYILNHRYLSLLEGAWDPTYMTESPYSGAPLENASLTMMEPSIDTQQDRLIFTMENHTGHTLSFGSMYSLEALLDNHWYYLGDMINCNVNIGWTTILYNLKNDDSMGDTYHLKYLQPLPAGSYRLVKSVATEEGSEGYLTVEFEVE